jgi:hypothetical protein
MRKYIRAILADLGKKRKDYTPPVPAVSTNASATNPEPKPQASVPDDLNNQDLSNDPSERVRQLDYQAQRGVEKGTLPG